ncbi:MAG: LCP family protein [Agathobacter sp.]
MSNKETNKKNNKLWILVVIIIVVIAAIVIGLAATKGKDKPQSNDTEQDSSAVPEKQVTIDKNILEEADLEGSQTLVFFGVDTRGDNLGKGTRSDSIMVVQVDHDAKLVKVASIYRDTMMHMEGHGYEKITHAHSYGGPEYAMETINENLDLNITEYVTVNFITMADIVDKVGGVTIDLSEAEASKLNVAPGEQLLDGAQAVTYSRIRSTAGGDYKRSERQREVLFKLFEKVKGMDLDTRVQVAEDMTDLMNTSLRSNEITELFSALSKYEIAEMTAYPQIFYGGTVEGAWVEVPTSLVDMAAGMHGFLLGETEYTPSDTVKSYSDTMSAKVSGPNHDFREEEETSEESSDTTQTPEEGTDE